MALLMHILRTDNEENAVLSLKIMIDLHRNYKTVVADQVQPFLDFVFEMYQSMPAIVKEAFDTNSTVPGSTPAATVLIIHMNCVLTGSPLFPQSQGPSQMNLKERTVRRRLSQKA